MLARIEGEPAGSKGISLFVVPKLRPETGDQLVPNDVVVAGVYHKLGYRGAPITELSIGEKNDCRGFLVGEKNRGLACMFQMMNEARLGVGLGATAIATAAYYAALDYAMERPQGRRLSEKDPATPQVSIIEHPDVKRMLLFQRAVVEGSLSLCLQCCLYTDLAKITQGDEQERNGIMISGIPGHDVENVVLENIDISYPGGGTAEDAQREVAENIARYPEQFFFGVLPSWGAYIRHAENIEFKNVKLTTRAPDVRQMIVTVDVEGFVAD
jgi:alkylation response protein AidB-like acyl-CoA dehydrogenase